MITKNEIRQRLEDIEGHLKEEYNGGREEKQRDWRTYEQRLHYRIKNAMKNLRPLIRESISSINIVRGRGRKPALTLQEKVELLLLKILFDKSNRNMECMLTVFSLLSDIDVSYKTIERLYSDPEVELALWNLHTLLLKKKGLRECNTSGDGTGYSLTIKKNYANEASKRKDGAKKNKTKGKKPFVYSFKLLDLDTWLYVAYGSSLKSEKDAFNKAMVMLEKIDVEIKTVRLDKYYSFPSVVDKFGDAKVYVIPRKNSTLKGSWKWKRTMYDFVENPITYLEEYYKRNNSESGFSADKRLFGWEIAQRRQDRIDNALSCQNLWHNLFNLY